jgi:hypothetical protein
MRLPIKYISNEKKENRSIINSRMYYIFVLFILLSIMNLSPIATLRISLQKVVLPCAHVV